MQILTLFLVALVALEHIGIAGLEMFAKPEIQANAFDMPVNFVKTKEAQTALANQGIYNGMLGLLILVNDFIFHWFSFKNDFNFIDALYHRSSNLRRRYSNKENPLPSRCTSTNSLDFCCHFLSLENNSI
jgi:Predicted membrane protein